MGCVSMLFDACVDTCVTGLFEVLIDDVSKSYDILEPCGGGWDGRLLCAGDSEDWQRV